MKKKKWLIKKSYHWCYKMNQFQRSCSLIWKHNLNKSTHILLNPRLKTQNNPNGRCFQPNNYTSKYKWNIKEIYNNYVFNLKINQVKILMIGNVNLRV
jgi:hypothetical protein